ncbi:MAG: O-antigen ligase family protein [Phormidium sp.]
MQLIYLILLIILGIISVVYFLLFLRFSQIKSVIIIYEQVIIIALLMTAFGVTVFPFNYLNPAALAGHDKKDWSLILQLSIYGISLLMIRSRTQFIVQSSKNIFKAPFLLALIVFTVLSTAWSGTPLLTLRAGIVLFGVAIFATYVSTTYNWSGLTQLLRWAITTIGLVSIPVSILLPSVGRGSEKEGWNGILGHPNPFGGLMALNAVLWLLNAWSYPQYRRRSLVFFCISFGELILANSGGALINFVILMGILTLYILFRSLNFRSSFFALLFLIGFSVVGCLWLTSNIEFILGLVGKDATLTGRTGFWPQVIEAILKRPIGGYGYTAFWQPWRGEANPAYGIADPVSSFIPQHSHNGYLDLGLDLGMTGLLLFVFSLIQALYQMSQNIKNSKATEAIVPSLFLTFLLIKNFSEAGLWILGSDSFLYILISVRLAIDGLSRHYDREFKPNLSN